MSDGFDLAELEKRANGHSVFAPSGSAMWLACSGSLIANLLAPDTAGQDAALGTVAHSVAEEWLRTGEKPEHRLGEIVPVREGEQVFNIEIDREMLGYVGEYVAWCQEAPGDHHVETRVDFSDLTPIPNQGGTADHAACANGHLIITDLKFGVGVQVFAKENPQAQLYAYGFVREWDWFYDFDRVTIRVCQPRLGHFDVWETTKAELLAFAEYVRDRALLAWRPNAPRTPGPKQCRFCRVRPTCPALAALTDAIVDESFGEGVEVSSDTPIVVRQPRFPRPPKLSTAQLATIYRYRRLMETWFREIGEMLERRAGDGEAVPGFKLVTGRSRREWDDEETTPFFLDVLGDRVFTHDLISPNQAGKELRKLGFSGKEVQRLLAGLVVTKPGRQTLVPEGDVREGELNITDASFAESDEA